MREIKFRAWDKEDKEMYCNVGLRPQNWNSSKHYEIYHDDFSSDECDGWLCDDEFEIMQYIGLKDKNGKEIYDGDIVKIKINHNSTVYEGTKPTHYSYSVEAVTFYNCRFLTYDFKNKQPICNHSPQGLREIDSDKRSCYQYEIIGNIYENPELLKEKS